MYLKNNIQPRAKLEKFVAWEDLKGEIVNHTIIDLIDFYLKGFKQVYKFDTIPARFEKEFLLNRINVFKDELFSNINYYLDAQVLSIEEFDIDTRAFNRFKQENENYFKFDNLFLRVEDNSLTFRTLYFKVFKNIQNKLKEKEAINFVSFNEEKFKAYMLTRQKNQSRKHA